MDNGQTNELYVNYQQAFYLLQNIWCFNHDPLAGLLKIHWAFMASVRSKTIQLLVYLRQTLAKAEQTMTT